MLGVPHSSFEKRALPGVFVFLSKFKNWKACSMVSIQTNGTGKSQLSRSREGLSPCCIRDLEEGDRKHIQTGSKK